jgi:hypothetical protein
MSEASASTAETIGTLGGREQDPRPIGLADWFRLTSCASDDQSYWFSLLQEVRENRDFIIEELRSVVDEAHSDARLHLRQLAGTSLDPLGEGHRDLDPADGYPYRLDLTTLKGYFGECFAGIVVQHFQPFGEPWEIPAYLFRFHTVALQRLERVRQGVEVAGAIPGRPGDDFLAFQRDDAGEISKTLVGEAKCTSTHRADMISSAHT